MGLEGNATGFTSFEYSLIGKWIELLKQIAPHITRVAVLRDPTAASGIGQFSAIQTVAQSLGVELTPLGVRNTDEIERKLAVFARWQQRHDCNGGRHCVSPQSLNQACTEQQPTVTTLWTAD